MNPKVASIGASTKITDSGNIPYPSNLYVGQGLILFLSARKSNSSNAPAPDIAGWTKIASQDNASSNSVSIGVYHKIVTSTDISTGYVTVSWSSNVDDTYGNVISINDCPDSSKISTATYFSASTNPHSFTGISTMYKDALMLGFSGSYRGITGGSYLTDVSLTTDDVTFSELVNYNPISSIRHCIWGSENRSSTNSTGNISFTYSSSSTYGSDAFIAIFPIGYAPTVTTQDATSITSTTATSNGNITDIGSENSYERGVSYIPASSGDITFVPILNPSFEGEALRWTTGAGTTIVSTEQAKYGTKSAKITFTSEDEGYTEQHFTASTYQGKTITFGCWVYSSDSTDNAHIEIYDHNSGGNQYEVSTNHNGDSTWQYLTCKKTIRADADDVFVRLVIKPTNIIEPSIVNAVNTTHIKKNPDVPSESTTNYPNESTSWIIQDYGTNNYQQSVIMKFDVSSYTLEQLASVKLKIKVQSADTVGTLNINKLRRTDWVYNQCTSAIYKTGSNWGTVMASNSSTDYDTANQVITNISSSWAGTWKEFDISAIAQDAKTNTSGIVNILLWHSPSASTGVLNIYDNGNTDTSVRPYLSISNVSGNSYFDGAVAAYATEEPIIVFDSGDYSTGAFTKNITGLTRTTDYRVAAFASNQYGTVGGSTVGFKTLSELPTVTTVGVNSISQSSLTANGNLTDSGGEDCEVGFVWSTTLNPTISDNKVVVGTLSGTYNTLITGFTANTAYHIRAYATNTTGTTYGADVAFTTLSSGPMIKRRVSFLSKAQSITIQLSNNEVDETFTVLQFAVTGSKEDKKTFSPLGIVSIN